MSEEEFFTVIAEPDENQRWQYIVACGHWTHDEDKAAKLAKKLAAQSARIAELEEKLAAIEFENKRLVAERDTIQDAATVAEMSLADVSAERDRAVEIIDKLANSIDSLRDTVLHQRGPLAENGMDSSQVNDVLGAIDDETYDATTNAAKFRMKTLFPTTQEGR